MKDKEKLLAWCKVIALYLLTIVPAGIIEYLLHRKFTDTYLDFGIELPFLTNLLFKIGPEGLFVISMVCFILMFVITGISSKRSITALSLAIYIININIYLLSYYLLYEPLLWNSLLSGFSDKGI
ncbi:MAG: hypothetical protein JW709_01720 [Sedimentisphaerales bacterium]|nr:hypothetical protein [Sedimentisphaerales bacterium]